MTDNNFVPEETCRKPGARNFNSLKLWFLRRWIPIFGLLLIIALVIGLFLLYRNNPEIIDGLERFGYLGAFLISIVLNATLVLPAGNFLVLAALGATLPSATLVGLAGGLGAAIGESTGYLAGYSGRAIIDNRNMYNRTEGWMKRWGFWALFGLSAAPLFFDLAGIAAGACRYRFWKFFLACWLGRSILYVTIAWAGLKGWEWLLNIVG
ncbi:MAG: VTT domain-containing protein [Dehalococcoidales bacterium]